MPSIIKNVGALSVSKFSIVALQFLALPVLARYLTTAEFGVVALAMSVVVFCQTLSDAGLGRSLIRQPSFDRAEWSSVLWFLTFVGLLLAAVVFFSANALSIFFESPDLKDLLRAMALLPLLFASAAVPTAYLEKHNRFGVIATVRLFSALAGLVTVLGLAVSGAGAWALVAQQICIAAIDLVAVWIVSGFRPSLSFRAHDLTPHFTFARDNIGVSLMMTAQKQVPVMLISYGLGNAALGLYAMAQRLLRLPLMGFGGPFSQVVYIRMTRAKDRPARVGEIYLEAVRAKGFVIFPPMFLLAAVGEQAFGLLLSDAWTASGLIFALAAPGVALEVATSSAGVAFQAVGKTGLRLHMATERAILRTAVLAVAVPFGLEAVAVAISVFAFLYLPRFWQFTRRAVTFDMFKAAMTLFSTTLVSIAGAGLLALILSDDANTVDFLLGTLGTLMGTWLLAGALQFKALRRSLQTLN